MVYVRGGGAWVDTQLDMTQSAITTPGAFLITAPNAPIFDTKYSGWTIGGGIEWMVASNWSAFAEYNYYNFKNKDIFNVVFPTIGPINLQGQSLSSGLNISTVTVGVNYRFNWSNPVYAKY
jgi:outer membrane immunogenic protein